GPLIYTLSSGPLGMSINSSTGLLQWTSQALVGSRVKVEVRDAQGGRAVLGFLLGVETPMAFGSAIGTNGIQGSGAFVVVDVAAGMPAMHVQLDASIGDPDLLLIDPDGVLVDAEGVTGLLETAMISQPKSGRWTIGISAFRTYVGTLSVTAPPVTPVAFAA